MMLIMSLMIFLPELLTTQSILIDRLSNMLEFCHNARNESFEIGQKIIGLAVSHAMVAKLVNFHHVPQ